MSVPQRSLGGMVEDTGDRSPWPALWALCVGFFMILVDTTIVSVATPTILTALHTDVDSVVWVTSAYLLAYAVPLLITGRLGDRFGPRRVYFVGLTVFTLASLWCGLTGTIDGLIAARVVQGLGASVMMPQTMAVITRTFPAESRGRAMSLWGAVAGVATLVGPILGGVLVDGLGWEWIFFVNVPVGVVGLVLAVRLVPELPTHVRRFDLPGVVLSAVGMFLLVFGIQEGQTYDWGTISGPISVWSLIVAGVAVLAVFIVWQARTKEEPLLSLELFRDRNFSLACVAIAAVGFGVTAMAFPTDALRAGRARADAHPGRAAVRPDGRHLGQPVALRRTAHRPRPPALGRRVRARVLRRRPRVAGRGDGRQRRPSGSSSCRSRSSASPTGTCGRRSPPRPPATCR